MTLDLLLDAWREDPLTAPNLATWRSLPPRGSDLRPFPADLPFALAESLAARGITSFYSHQAQAWEAARRGEHVAVATGTASGKTLTYNLPVLATLLTDPQARALYLFPTKALTQDQFSVINEQCSGLRQSPNTEHWTLDTAIYDGDTPPSHRPQIRRNARILLTNPDMLHTGILPHHTNWAEFFRNLKFVVIDEMHTYRGVFGSHVANVIRRLIRVAKFYGASPQFILTSATIGNPQELAERLIEAPVRLIDQDGSGRGQRHFLVYNPPVLDEAIGLRKSSLLESVRLAQDLLVAGVQGVVFARSRRSVEMILKYLQESGESKVKNIRGADHSRLSTLDSLAIRGYRSGYLPSQRREIEKGLRDGSVRLVIATNGLELGIDIGGLETALLVGYPGTIASTWQQAGRAGRGDGPAAAVLIASANPIDQFLAHHPDYFFGRSPEQALINPDHLLILLNHLRCAMFELPFTRGETFGGNPVDEFLDVLAASHDAHLSQDKYYWMADSYPAANISLRSASPESYVLQVTDNDGPNIIGIVDGESAFWMTHPGAVYLHEARQYFVEDLDREKKIARLRPLESDYFTEPLKQTTIQVLSIHQQETIFDTRRPPAPNVGEGSLVPRHPSPVTRSSPPATHAKGWGELQVTTQVTGFRKLRWYSRENLGEEPLDLPPTDLQTTGYWLSISDETVEQLSKEGLWTNAPNDYGPGWNRIREAVRQRDSYRCQVCGRVESNGRQHAVHHKIPFRYFMRTSTSSRSALERQDLGTKPGEIALREVRNPKSPDFGAKSGDFALREASYSLENVRTRANDPGNLTTLCTECHQKVEANVRIRSGLAGLAYALGNLALLFLMCDPGDLGTHVEPVQSEAFPQPSAVLYDLVPAGIGFSQKLFEMHAELLRQALELVSECSCEDGCPSCVGPGGENGMGGKAETLSLLKTLVGV